MKKDYYNTLIKDIIENNDKEKAIEIIVNKLNEKQTSNEKEMLINIEKEVREYIENENDNQFEVGIYSDETGGFIGTDLSKGAKHILEILDKGE